VLALLGELFGTQNRVSLLEGRKIPGSVAQPGDRQEILGKLSIPCVALLSLYSPNCVEGKFSEVELRVDGVLRSSV
jgi:hypothetical protein